MIWTADGAPGSRKPFGAPGGLLLLLALAAAACSGGGGAFTGNMTSPRHGHTATALPDGRVLIAAGLTKTSPLGTFELFEPLRSAFEALAIQGFRPRGWHSAAALKDGRILLSGGWAGPFTALREAAILHPGEKRLQPLLMLQGRYDHTSTLLEDGAVLLAGGNDGRGEQRAMELFDPPSGKFAPAARPLLVPRQQHTATPLPGGQVLILGGGQGQGARLAEIYLPTERRTRLVRGFTSVSRSRHTATPLMDGRVLIAGGLGPERTLATAEIYDPGKDAFLPIQAPLRTARQQHTATLLSDGRVVLLGGWGGGEGKTLDDGEIFDPQGSCFAALPFHMKAKRRLHTAALVRDGSILAAGGASDDDVLPSAELLRVPPRKPGRDC